MTVYKPLKNVKEVYPAPSIPLFQSGSFRFYPALTLFEESLIALVPRTLSLPVRQEVV
jgi:hypothetical protein